MVIVLNFATSSEEQLIEAGITFGATLEKGQVIVLKGELGAGKTTFVKGVARSLGIEEPITSPTYTISKLYDGKLCHVDAYRISEEDIGLEDLISEGYIICIEWAENLADYLPAVDYKINIEYTLEGRNVNIEKVD